MEATENTRQMPPPPHPGYERVFDSVRMNLRVAHAHSTALNAKELWARTDFSALPVEKRQTFTAFSAWLRAKVDAGLLVSRPEDDTERSIRLNGNRGRFARHATLFSLAAVTQTVPQVFKRYDEIEPLTAEQEAWLAKNMPITPKPKKRRKVQASAPATPAAPAAEVKTPEVMVLTPEFESAAAARIAFLEAENSRLRKAVSLSGMALTALGE